MITYYDFSAEGQIITRKDTQTMVSGTKNKFKARFTFSLEWDDIISKTAVFQQGLVVREVQIIDGECYIPPECMATKGDLFTSVYGNDLYTSIPAKIYVLKSGALNGAPPDPVITGQIYVRSYASPTNGISIIRVTNGVLEYYNNSTWYSLSITEGMIDDKISAHAISAIYNHLSAEEKTDFDELISGLSTTLHIHDLANLNDDATHRTVTDTEKSTWNAKQDALTADVDYLTPSTAALTYEPLKGDDDNYVTDAELLNIQDIPNLMKLDGSNSNIDVLTFNTAYVPTGLETTGQEYWDSANHTKSVVLEGGVTGQLFQEQHTYGKNTSGVNILNGQAVSISSVGGSFTTFALTDVTDAVSAKAFAGIATQDIAINAFGYITTVGLVREINTDAWNEGVPVYVSCVTAGNLTTALPSPDCYVIKVGTVEYKHAVNGRLNVSSTIYPKLEDLSGVNGTPLSVTGQLPVWDNESGYFDFTKNANDFKTYSGFENRTDSAISISGAGLFSVSPVSGSFNVFTNGTGKHVISNIRIMSITDDQTITYIYFDSNGDLQKSLSPWDLSSGVVAPCAIVFKDGTNYALTDERHSYERNKSWHNWTHFNVGATHKSGFAGTFGDSSLSVTQGVIYDEDIKFDSLSTQTLNTIWFRNATNGMRMVRGIARPYYFNVTLKYDNLGVITDVDNNKYVSNWVYASNDPVQPIYTVTGQQQSTTLAQARNTPTPVINLSTAEWKLLYKVIYQQTGGGVVFIEATDYRNVSTGVPGNSVTPTSHSGLTDRDVVNSHPATAIGVVPTGNITATTVETALQELDSEKLAKTANITAIDDTGIADGEIMVANLTSKKIETSNVLIGDLALKAQETWITPTLINSWVEYDSDHTPQYRKNQFGELEMKGWIKSGTLGTVAFAVASGYYPTKSKRISNYSLNLGGGSTVGITGNITPSYGSTALLSFDGVIVALD